MSKMFLIKVISKITRWKKFRNRLDLIFIACFLIVFVMLFVFFLGLIDFNGPSWTILFAAGLVLLMYLGMQLVFHYYSEEIREAEQKEEKMLVFKPATVSIIFFLFLILLGISWFFNPPVSKDASHTDVINAYIGAILLTGVGLWMGYTVAPVFRFAEDSVQIKSYLFYLFHIDRKTVIRYADITQVIPDMRVINVWGAEACEYAPIIYLNGTTQRYPLVLYDGDTIEELWVRFREKLGDKVLMP